MVREKSKKQKHKTKKVEKRTKNGKKTADSSPTQQMTQASERQLYHTGTAISTAAVHEGPLMPVRCLYVRSIPFRLGWRAIRLSRLEKSATLDNVRRVYTRLDRAQEIVFSDFPVGHLATKMVLLCSSHHRENLEKGPDTGHRFFISISLTHTFFRCNTRHCWKSQRMILLYRAGEGSLPLLHRGQHTLAYRHYKLTPTISLASHTLCFVLSSTSMFDRRLNSVISWPREVPIR